MVFSYTTSSDDWAHIAPLLTLLGGALLVMLIDMILPTRIRSRLVFVALLGVLAAIVSTIIEYGDKSPADAFNGMIRTDPLALFGMTIILIGTGISLLLAPGYIERQGVRQQGEFYTLVMIAATGMLLLVSSNSLMTIFLGIELLSLPLYVLCAFAPGQKRAQESGMKYFLLSSFASGFLLYGMSLTYGATGSTSLANIQKFISDHPFDFTSGSGPLLLAGMGLMAVGLTFKISAIPFHAWTPDVYEGAPTPITALMSVGTKTAAFVALIRIFPITFGSLIDKWQGIFWGLAILTMLGGNVLAATQSNIKRLLAYSSIAHAGYIMIGLVIGTQEGIAASMYYLAAYMLMNTGAFGVVIALERVAGLGTEMNEYNGLANRRPKLAATMAILLFALAGIPGTVGFMAKYTVFAAAANAGHAELMIVGVVASMIGFYYYLRVIWVMYFTSSTDKVESEIKVSGLSPSGSGTVSVTTSKTVSVARPIATGVAIGLILTVVGTITLGIIPSWLIDAARNAAGLP
jgi:NADH-quinone oxidoreductase subunit N